MKSRQKEVGLSKGSLCPLVRAMNEESWRCHGVKLGLWGWLSVKAVASLDAATAALNGTASELRLLGEKEFQAFSKRIADVAKVYGLEHVARKQRDVDAELALLKTEQELVRRSGSSQVAK